MIQGQFKQCMLLTLPLLVAGCGVSGPDVRQAGVRDTRLDARLKVWKREHNVESGIRVDVKSRVIRNELWFSVRLSNVTDIPLKFGLWNRPEDYQIVAFSGSGQRLPLTSYGARLRDEYASVFRPPIESLSPQETLEVDLPIDRIVDISQDDTYTIFVTRQVPTRSPAGEPIGRRTISSPPVRIVTARGQKTIEVIKGSS